MLDNAIQQETIIKLHHLEKRRQNFPYKTQDNPLKNTLNQSEFIQVTKFRTDIENIKYSNYQKSNSYMIVATKIHKHLK